MVTGLCTMCEEAPATTTWGFPVCQPCADFLAMLDDDLKRMEAGDSALKVAGERVEAAFDALRGVGDPDDPTTHTQLLGTSDT